MPPYFDEADLRRNFEGQETQELQGRIEQGLEPEAESLARQILAERGVNLIAHSAQSLKEYPAIAIWTPELRQKEQEMARKLWRSILVKACQFLFFLLPGALVSSTLNLATKKAFTSGDVVLIAVAMYAGYWVGMKMTRKIVESDTMRYPEKVKRIWVLIVGVVLTSVVLAHLLRLATGT